VLRPSGLSRNPFVPVGGFEEPGSLGPYDVHVWCIPLDVGAAAVNRLARSLSIDERTRAQRFRAERDARRYIAAHGALRRLLARYMNEREDRIEFRYGASGKPAVECPVGATRIRFNMSHSGSIALIALCARAEIGIDVEQVRDISDAAGVVHTFFTPDEAQRWRALPASGRTQAFYDGWTRKEALVKAVGDGLSMALDSFEVPLNPGESGTITLPRQGALAWSILDVSPSPGYSAALAIPAELWNVHFRQASTSWPVS